VRVVNPLHTMDDACHCHPNHRGLRPGKTRNYQFDDDFILVAGPTLSLNPDFDIIFN
jgi:hypothetical protein